MAITISHRNQNTTDPHASGRPSPVVGGMVRIDGQRWLVKYQEGPWTRPSSPCFPLQKNLGFIANLRQAHYKSNHSKTTPQRATAGRETPHPDIPRRALPASVRPEPVEACPEVTRRGSPTTNSPRITPSPPPPREPHPVAPDGTLTRPYCPHSSASATVSPWQSQSPTATRTPPVPMPPGAPARSLAAWSASMVRGGSSSIRRGCFPSAKKSWIYS